MDPITKTEACKLTGFSKERVAKALAGLTPAHELGRIVRYDAVAAIRACIQFGEGEKERAERLKADILEVKLKRMNNEQIDLKQAQSYCSELLTRLADTIKYMDGLTREQASVITQQIQEEAIRLSEDLATATFDDGEEEFDGEEEERT